MQSQTFFVYIVTNLKRTLYIGMTRNLPVRIEQHQSGKVKGFSSRHRTHTLVWCETAESFESVRNREKELKGWRRSKKIALIEAMNPHWQEILASVA